MYPKNRRRKSTENMDFNIAERDNEEDNEEHQRINMPKSRPKSDSSKFNVSVPVGNDKSAAYISHLLYEADLPALIQLDTVNQIKYFLDERAHMINQMELVRTQYEKQYSLLKRRLDETENENERLTTQNRSTSKELILYKNLSEAPMNPDSPRKSKDYQQLKLTMEKILQENQHLYSELHHFKTSDPIYDQVKSLETTNKNLKSRLAKIIEECEQLKLINQKLLQQQTSSPSSPKQIHHSSSPAPLNQQQFSPKSHRSSKSSLDENLPSNYSPNEIIELREHVQHLEQTLKKRDYELQKLQNEIEKGTSSIMSSIEDLYIVSSNVTSANIIKMNQPSIDDLQNELDQLHDKLDDLTRENQILKNRTQEFDTIYEENEYLYAEKSQWNEELERSRLRQLVLEQENHSLKEREKEIISTDDTTNNPNLSQLKLKVEWFNHTNNELELEIVRAREQIDHITKKYEQAKRDLVEKNQHYKQILQAAEDTQKLPYELARIEKLNSNLESQFENDRLEYEKTIAALEEQSEKREQKYSSLYDTIIKLQNDYRQKELDIVHQMDDVVKQRDTLHTQLASFQHVHEQLQQENKSLKEEISSKNEINRDLKLAFTSSNNDAQTIYNQLRQLSTNLNDLQQKYDHDIQERNSQIEHLRTEQKQVIAKYDGDLLKTHQTIIQLQHDNKQYSTQLERYQLNIDKLQNEIHEKQNFIDQIQNDLSERSALHVSINNQLSQENKVRMMKITELEQALSQEQQYKNELQRSIQDLQNELLKSRSIAKESLEKSEEFERRFHETDKHFLHLNETTEPTRREVNTLRTELLTKSDQVTALQHTLDDEKLKRQRLEMKLKRLKDEYVTVRKELYNRIEDNNTIQHELVEYRFKADYYSQMYNQAFQSNENQSSTAVQLYLKEKADNQHYQLKCATYQQKVEQVQKNYDTIKDKYKQRLQEERDLFERTKIKYLDHIKNVQKDLNETRQLLEKDTELKMNQESAYQQLVEERRRLLTSMIDKDAKVREMRRENLLLTSKIQLLEKQMENLNERVDRTLRERSLFRRDGNNVRLDTNVSIGTSARSSPILPSGTTTTYIDSTNWTLPVYYTESFGFNNGHQYETSIVS